MLVLLSELVGSDVENGVVTGGTGIVVVDVVSTICAVVVGDNVVVIVVVPGVVVLVLLLRTRWHRCREWGSHRRNRNCCS